MYLPDFNYHKPTSLQDALALQNKSENAAFIAGGTDLLVEIKKGFREHTDIISLSKVEELKTIEEDKNNLYIGAGVTHSELMLSSQIKKFLPALTDAASKIGSEQVRNTGTLGGNLCTAASCCDTAPILLSMNASLEIVDADKVKTIPLKDFFVFNKKTILKKGEIVSKVIVPKPAQGVGAYFEKFGLREAGAISVVSVAVMVKVKDGICVDASVVIGAVAPTPRISDKASEILKGKDTKSCVSTEVLAKAGQAAADDSIPIDDIRGAAQYRRELLKVLTQRAIVKAIASI